MPIIKKYGYKFSGNHPEEEPLLSWFRRRQSQADERRVKREQEARMLLLEAMAHEPDLWWGTLELMEVTGLNSGRAAVALMQLRLRELVVAEQHRRTDSSRPRTLFQLTASGIQELNTRSTR